MFQIVFPGCIISAKYSYSTINFVYDIGFRLRACLRMFFRWFFVHVHTTPISVYLFIALSSVTSSKSPNVYKMISVEQLKLLTPLQKLPKNVRDLGELIVAKGFKSCTKSNKSPNLVTLSLSYLERAHEGLIDWHHAAGVIKLSAVVGRGEEGDELTFCEELVAVLYNLKKIIWFLFVWTSIPFYKAPLPP